MPRPHPGGGGGGGGTVSLGLVHHPRKSLSEKHPKRGWSDDTHSSLNTTPRVRTGVSLPNKVLPFPRIVRGPVRGICQFDTLYSYFPVFDTLNAIRALRVRWRKRYPFYAFSFTRMMYKPQWDMPPPPPPGGGGGTLFT